MTNRPETAGTKKSRGGWLILAGLALLPCTPSAAKECRVIEYPDHYEALCVGDPNYALKQPGQADSTPDTTKGAQVSRRRQRIDDVRSLNSLRFNAAGANSAPGPVEKKK